MPVLQFVSSPFLVWWAPFDGAPQVQLAKFLLLPCQHLTQTQTYQDSLRVDFLLNPHFANLFFKAEATTTSIRNATRNWVQRNAKWVIDFFLFWFVKFAWIWVIKTNNNNSFSKILPRIWAGGAFRSRYIWRVIGLNDPFWEFLKGNRFL